VTVYVKGAGFSETPATQPTYTHRQQAKNTIDINNVKARVLCQPSLARLQVTGERTGLPHTHTHTRVCVCVCVCIYIWHNCEYTE
jgi:hypothetical protein